MLVEKRETRFEREFHWQLDNAESSALLRSPSREVSAKYMLIIAATIERKKISKTGTGDESI